MSRACRSTERSGEDPPGRHSTTATVMPFRGLTDIREGVVRSRHGLAGVPAASEAWRGRCASAFSRSRRLPAGVRVGLVGDLPATVDAGDKEEAQ